MRVLVFLLIVISTGCATAPTRHALKSAPQNCVEFCHDYALGLVDVGSARQAGPIFDIAEKHFEDTSRPDIPQKEWQRVAMRVELALGRAATARANGGDIHPPLIAAVKAFSELLDLQAPRVWDWIALDFLRDADILRFDREWDAIKVDPGARFVLRQFLLVQRGSAPDLLLIKERADHVKGLNQLVALSYILTKSGDFRTVIAQGVNERLFEELKVAEIPAQQVVLEMQLTSNFVYWATPEHRDSVRWIMQKATELEVRGWFMPVTAITDVSDRCEVIKPYYKTLLGAVRNDLEALDLLMGCIIRWGSTFVHLRRMAQVGLDDSRTVNWKMFAGWEGFNGLELEVEGIGWEQLLTGEPPEFKTQQLNGLPWEDLLRLRLANTNADFRAELGRFSRFPFWHFWVARFLIATGDSAERAHVFAAFEDHSSTRVWEALTTGSINEQNCGEVLDTAFFEARRGGIRAVFPLLNLAPDCKWAQSRIREVFVTPDEQAEFAPLGRFKGCSAEQLKTEKPNSNEVVWCDVLHRRVKMPATNLEMSEYRAERDTAVHALISLNQIAEARRVFESYDHVTRYDFSTDQLLRVYEGKSIDIPGLRFSTLWGQEFSDEEIVPTLWSAGRHAEACDVLAAMTSAHPWISHPGNVDCPATNAAYKELWGFDPPWTLPQDEVLAFLRQAPETK